MIITIILNDAPYGNERSYNALRYATALLTEKDISIQIFLMADAVFCGLKDQTTPEGYYNIGRMISILLKRNVKILACGTCLNARGITEDKLIEGVLKSSMPQLAAWTKDSNQVINY